MTATMLGGIAPAVAQSWGDGQRRNGDRGQSAQRSGDNQRGGDAQQGRARQGGDWQGRADRAAAPSGQPAQPAQSAPAQNWQQRRGADTTPQVDRSVAQDRRGGQWQRGATSQAQRDMSRQDNRARVVTPEDQRNGRGNYGDPARQNRQDWRNADGGNRQDGRNDGRNDNRWNNGRDNNWRGNDGRGDTARNGNWNNGGSRGDARRYDDRTRWSNQQRWNNNWRQDRRYDWSSYRARYGDRFRAGSYYAPRGWAYGYRSVSIGYFLSSLLYSNNYWLDDPYSYRLPPAYGSLRWVRYYDDALLVDTRDGYVVDAIRDFFW